MTAIPPPRPRPPCRPVTSWSRAGCTTQQPVSSLVWYATDYDRTTIEIAPEYQGTQRLCVRPRAEFIGCSTARIVVRDPHTAEDSEEVRTCWEDIRIFLPFTRQRQR